MAEKTNIGDKKRSPKKKATKKTPKVTRAQMREALQANLNERFGVGAVRKASEVPDVFSLRRPTGIPQLDLILKGGFPAGGPSHIIGEEGAGKTDLTWRVLAQAQKNYGPEFSCAIACVEHWPDYSQGRFCGMQIPHTTDELRQIELASGEALSKEDKEELQAHVGHELEVVPNDQGIERLLDIVVDMFVSGLYQVIVVDSVGAMQPSTELMKELGESNKVAALSIVLTNFMKKIWAASMSYLADGTPNETTLLLLNQFREEVNLRNPRMNALRIGGGRALKHGKLVDLLLRKGPWIKSGEGINAKKIGKFVSAQVLKGKAGMHEGATSEWEFYQSYGVDIPSNLLAIGMDCGEISLAGSYYTLPDGSKVQGKAKAKVAVMPFYDQIMAAAYAFHEVPAFRKK